MLGGAIEHVHVHVRVLLRQEWLLAVLPTLELGILASGEVCPPRPSRFGEADTCDVCIALAMAAPNLHVQLLK